MPKGNHEVRLKFWFDESVLPWQMRAKLNKQHRDDARRLASAARWRAAVSCLPPWRY